MLLDVPQEVHTPRLVVRCYGAGDGRALHAAATRNRTHLSRFEAGNVLLTAGTEEQGEILARELHARWVSRDAFFAGAFLHETGGFVGQVYLGPVDWELPAFDLGYIADCQHEGKGLVTEAVMAVLGMAFDRLAAHRITVRTDAMNTRSQRVAQRCGFALEGCLREAHRQPDGSVSSEYVYGLLRSDAAAARDQRC